MPATYRTSRLQRGLSVLSVGALLLLAAAGYGLRATVRVSETAVRKTRPLWTDNVLRFEDIQRLHLPVTTEALQRYTEPNGSPDLSIEAQSFERFGSLARRVLRRLPQHTEIQDPAGRVEEYQRGGDAAGENQTDDGQAGRPPDVGGEEDTDREEDADGLIGWPVTPVSSVLPR